MSKIPENLLYTKEHEWIRVEDGKAYVGITDYAQDQLGDVVFVEIPEIGDEFAPGDGMVVIESVKAVADVFAPVSGLVEEVNEELLDRPELVNESPYDDGWMVLLTIEDETQLEDLLDSAGYGKFLEEEA
jgi:glycine cleavage system H protein